MGCRTRESVTMVSFTREHGNALFHIRRRPNSNLQEIANGVHCLDKISLGGSLRPKVSLRIGLREDARGADEVPRGQREACVSMILLRRDVLTDKIRERGNQDLKKRHT